jgi:DNA-binding beta-propeller fold protein YncE
MAVGFAIVFMAGLLSCRPATVTEQPIAPANGFAAVPGEKGGQDILGAYEVVEGWPRPLTALPGHEQWGWSAVQSIFAESPNRVFITQRGELPALERPSATLVPQSGPGLSFPVGQYPFRNASQGPAMALPGAFGGGGHPGPFDRDPNYVLAPDQVAHERWEGTVGVDARWEHCIVVVDAEGNILPETTEVWQQWDHLFGYPHHITINPYDPEKHVWVVEAARHVIYKFTNDGTQLVQTIGTPNEPGHDATHFNRPTFIAWLPDSTMFVTDGYVNTRVAKFDPDGNFLMEWGQKGVAPNETRPGYFNTVHGLAVDPATRRVYVNDRSNLRIQIFDENGQFLDQWSTGPDGSQIYTIYFSEGKLWAADSHTRRIIAWNPEGFLQYAFGGQGEWAGATDGVHGISVDQEGNLYLAELFHGRAMKYRPRQGANPDYLVGKPPYVAWKE